MQGQIMLHQNQSEIIEGITAEYPYVMHRENLEFLRVPWHWHEEIEIGYVEEGTLIVTIVGKQYTFSSGTAFFMNANVMSSMRNGSDGEAAVLVSHIFHPVFLSGHFRSVFETKYLLPVVDDRNVEVVGIYGESSRQKEILEKIQCLTGLQTKDNAEFHIRNLLSELWLLFMEEIKEQKSQGISPKPVSQERIQSMLAYIHGHYGEKITLDEIAGAALVSRRECLRCFQGTIHKTPFEYLQEYRIERADRMLKMTDKTVTEIALECGFSGAAYFGKIFRELRGMTPGEFRRQS